MGERTASSVAGVMDRSEVLSASTREASRDRMQSQDADHRDIQACLSGDGRAYERLVRRYEARVAAQMWRFSRDPDVHEELVQEVFVEAYFSLRRYRGDAPLLHWLRRIATRAGYRFWKKQARDRKGMSIEAFESPGVEDQDPAEPEVAASLLHALLAQLKPADRLVLTLMYLDECSTHGIAERTGWNRAMVKMRAHRARKKLRKIAERDKVWERLGWTP